MKNKLFSALFFCVAAMFPFSGALHAQEQPVRLGYCEDHTGGPLVPAGDAEAATINIGIKLPANLLKKYAGNKINRIDFAIEERASDHMTVFVTKDFEQAPVSSKVIKDHKPGWNSVTLDKPVDITGTEDLYICANYMVTAEKYATPVFLLDHSLGGVFGVNYYGKDGKFYLLKTNLVNHNFCIRAFADGGTKPKGDVGISDLFGNGMVVMDTPQTYTMQVRNFGMENVTSLTLDIKANDKTFETKELSGLSLAHNEQLKFEVPNVKFPLEGNNKFSVEVTKVNGIVDADPTDNMVSSPIYAVKPNAETYVHTPLFEEFTRESDEQSVEAHRLFKHVIDAYDKGSFIWVKHHVKDKFTLVNEEPDYGYFFGNGRPFTPSIMVDRMMFTNMPDDRGPAYLVEDSRVLESLFNEAKELITFVQPYIKVDYNKDTRQMDVQVDVESGVKEMLYQTDLKLSVYVVEDSIATTTQKGATGNYHQYGVIRKVLTEPWGDGISLEEYQLTKKYSLAVDPTWNPDNMRIVAFVHNQDMTNYANCQVYNTAQVYVSPFAGIDKAVLETGNGKPVVSYMGNRIWTANGYQVVGVYGVDGQTYSQTGLTNGMYIVKVTDGKHTHNVKLQINNR